ncbi:Alkaline shock protein 23 [compost metagenome]
MDVSVIVEYGNRLPEVAAEIQRNVKRSIETMTGLTVVEVNVQIHDVQFKAVEKNTSVEDTDSALRVK